MRANYVNDYHRREGISLDPDRIEKNPGLRSLAKLALNSFWGKWAQRENLRQTDYIYDPADFFQQVLDPTRDVQDFHIIDENTIQLEWKHREEFVPDNTKTKIFNGSFTTCWAHLKLCTRRPGFGRR